MDLCHNLKGRHVVYVLQYEPDVEGRETRYVGCSTNIERRTAEHLGLKAGGAAWCKKHKPKSVLECRVCQDKEKAAVMETMLTAVHQEQVGYQNCRGSRWNMPGMMRRKPPYFDHAEEYYTEEVTPEKDGPPWEKPGSPPPSCLRRTRCCATRTVSQKPGPQCPALASSTTRTPQENGVTWQRSCQREGSSRSAPLSRAGPHTPPISPPCPSILRSQVPGRSHILQLHRRILRRDRGA